MGSVRPPPGCVAFQTGRTPTRPLDRATTSARSTDTATEVVIVSVVNQLISAPAYSTYDYHSNIRKVPT